MPKPKSLAKVIVVGLGCSLVLFGCTAGGKDAAASSDVNFNLASSTADGTETQETAQVATAPKPLYENDGKYAYQLDPVSLERISGPLDMTTKEPISASTTDPSATTTPEPILQKDLDSAQYSDGIGGTTSTSSVDEPEVEESSPVEAPEESTLEPSEHTKLPNTGIFLEDD